MIAILGALYIVSSMFMNKPMDAMLAIGITFVGLPVYWLMK